MLVSYDTKERVCELRIHVLPLRFQECKALGLLLLLALLVHLSDFLLGRLVVATFLLKAATVV